MPVLELEALEESVLSAFKYSDNVVVFGKKKFAVPMGSEINSFIKFKRARPNSGGKAHVLIYPQRAMPASWNTAVQKPSDRILLAFCTSYNVYCIQSACSRDGQLRVCSVLLTLYFPLDWFAVCTGKSLIPETNPWLDFVIFQNSPGIRWAILCLAAVHLHDHVPDKGNEDRVIRNHGFGYRAIQLHKRAVAYLRTLLDCKQGGSSREIISLLIVLSTIDTLRIENRMKAPFEPAWYQGLRLAEKHLDKMGQKPWFWEEECWNQKIPKSLKDTLPIGFGEFQPTRQKISQLTSPHDTYPTNPMGTSPTSHQRSQPTSLRISQGVLVARGIILAQVMSKLPPSENFVPVEESRRFSWLLQASSEEVWTIHGGCGASPKLLHIMSQINYCATRLHQDDQSIVVPITAKKLLQLLYELKPTGSTEPFIDPTTKMIERTAYAWLLTAIIYLRCRVQRYG
ncbi:hypothetical protein FOPG_17942 [Fusarium oxysporum f. sp. conglutinans race 2 54008]|uniref:Transcription factor domain-containing protein n=1 Tax=Fusarium oxysporum f. sp. conglutinans race 2 54008 TaxID=1089457 RepID=X0H1A1_FUSOX|nr:hypothetical protein FOPG_17942 [Fusarium oxysporum f. sp. conglutinans race 2 54008]